MWLKPSVKEAKVSITMKCSMFAQNIGKPAHSSKTFTIKFTSLVISIVMNEHKFGRLLTF